MNGRVDGLLMMSPYIGGESLEDALPSGLPTVLMNTHEPAGIGAAFVVDDFRGARAMTTHLAAAGYQDIAQPRTRFQAWKSFGRTADVGNILIASGRQVSGHGARTTEIINHNAAPMPRSCVFMRTVGNPLGSASSRLSPPMYGDIISRPSTRPFIDRSASAASALLPCVQETSRCKPRVRAARSTRGSVQRNTPRGYPQQQPDGVGTAADQAARGSMWRVMQPARGAQHALRDVRGHRTGSC